MKQNMFKSRIDNMAKKQKETDNIKIEELKIIIQKLRDNYLLEYFDQGLKSSRELIFKMEVLDAAIEGWNACQECS